jgi:DNA (cytosine-5)-methyltransferase 1
MQWRKLGVDGMGIANAAPDETFPDTGLPRLTVRMAARIQSFPDDWQFAGGKTAAYRQVGNAFPPLVAQAVGMSIRRALTRKREAILPGEPPRDDLRLFDKYKPLKKSKYL